MRASTIFALTMALLLGLGAVVGARWAGWLGRIETPPRKEVQVLVAARNLFPGDLIETSAVKTRVLRPEETSEYDNNKQKYLPPVPAAANLRVANKHIEADVPILRDDLKELAKPEPLHLRLLPNMRAVNLSVQKDQSAGGLIQVGEWVDVYLTSNVTVGGQESTRTAPVAHRLRVIAKRNLLWNVFAALPDNKPVQFTLEANPYRSGLIEYGKTKGTLSMVPLSAAEQRVLEERRTRLLTEQVPVKHLPVSFLEPGQSDYDREEARVDSMNRGDYSIGTGDLVRLFDLQTPPPPRPEVVVEHFSGLARGKSTRYNAEGGFLGTIDHKNTRPVAAQKASPTGVEFANPADCKKCKSCGKGN